VQFSSAIKEEKFKFQLDSDQVASKRTIGYFRSHQHMHLIINCQSLYLPTSSTAFFILFFSFFGMAAAHTPKTEHV